MNTLNSIINWLLGIIVGGGISAILVTIFQTLNDPENRETHIKKIKNIIIFLVITLAIFQIKDLVISYFGTPVFQTY